MARPGGMFDVLDAAEREDVLRRQRDRRIRRQNPEYSPFYKELNPTSDSRLRLASCAVKLLKRILLGSHRYDSEPSEGAMYLPLGAPAVEGQRHIDKEINLQTHKIKRRQEQVNRGYQLLKRKAEALRIRGRQATAELAATQAVLGHTLKEAYISLAAVKFSNGESNAMILENVGEAQVRVQRISENISGVATESLQAIEDPSASDALRYAGLGAGGHRTSEAKKAFREAIKILIKFASLRNTCILLDEAVKTTLRKVNGIEKVIMPKLQNTETYIRMEMDEREREDFHRLKMVKAKKVRNQALANAHAKKKALAIKESLGDAGEIDGRPSDEEGMKVMHTAHYLSFSASESSGDLQSPRAFPTMLPHHWDDEDILF